MIEYAELFIGVPWFIGCLVVIQLIFPRTAKTTVRVEPLNPDDPESDPRFNPNWLEDLKKELRSVTTDK